MPEPIITASFDVQYASADLLAKLDAQVKNGVTTWGALLDTLGLTLDSPVLMHDTMIYTQPDRVDTTFRLRTRKEF
jgi:hypothetical protein